jgi:hypothetical protein
MRSWPGYPTLFEITWVWLSELSLPPMASPLGIYVRPGAICDGQ